MDHRQALSALKRAGTAQNRKVYARHGVSREMYGVSFAELGKLQKTIKRDHTLAEKLWASGNHDARMLATMILDPGEMTSAQWDAWAKELDNYIIADAYSKAVVRSPQREAKMKKWLRSRAEFQGQVSWNLVVSSAMREDDQPDTTFLPYLEMVEERIHRAPNRVRYSMLLALIAIGTRSRALHRKAIAAAKRIGTVEVDHGETGCRTPDPIPYMEKTWAHKDAKATRAVAKGSRAGKKV